MKKVTIRIKESAFEKFLGFIQLCPDIVVDSCGDCVEKKDVIDRCFAYAICDLRDRKVFKTSADYTYIMMAANDRAISNTLHFLTPTDFLAYLETLGLKNLTSRSTLYYNKSLVKGKYPNWTFADSDKVGQFEILRRKNIVVQFLSSFFKEKRRILDAPSEK